MEIQKEFRLYRIDFIVKILFMKQAFRRLAGMRAAQKRYALTLVVIGIFIPVVSFSCYLTTSRGQAQIERTYAKIMAYTYGPYFLCKMANETDPIIYSKIRIQFDWWVTSEQRQAVIDNVSGTIDEETSSSNVVIAVPAEGGQDIFRISKKLEQSYKEVTKTTVIRSMERTPLNF